MSFFGQKGDDSNLQYDDTAFLYFIASFVSIGAVVSLILVVKDLLSLSINFESKLSSAKIFDAKVQNLKKERKRAVLGKGFFIKFVSFVVLTLLFKVIYDISSQTHNKLKGFDPFDILGIPKDATLRDVKKAYRKLALEFHPDKNIGNAQAQNKFILISKSYQCFTDETKKANCFKYGNPDGQGSFRVGIGLPQFFINVEYQYYVLPVVLIIFLVLIPWGMISWNNKTKLLDHDGISINSYNTFFKCFANKKEAVDKYTFLYIMTSFPELYEDPSCRPITPEDRQELQKVLGTLKVARKGVYDQLSEKQLDILWQLLTYCSNRGEFRSESLRKKIEYFLGKTVNMILMFATKPDEQGDLILLHENPEWEVRYIGPVIIEFYLQFERDYFNRTLLIPRSNFLWIHSLDLDENSRNAILEGVQANKIPAKLYETITSPEKIAAMCELVGQQQRKSLESQLKELPIYQLDMKIKVGGEQKTSISNVDYAQIFFRVRRTNKTSGYTLLKNYPYPKKNSIYILATQNAQALFLQKIDFPYKQDEFVQKVDYRTGKLGNHSINVFCINQSYFQIDTVSQLNFKVTKVPEGELQRPIQYHPDDIHMEKLYKNFFETLVELDVDPEENELSDSDEEENQKPKKKKGHNHQNCDSDSSSQSDEILD